MRRRGLTAADFAALRSSGMDARCGELRARVRINGCAAWRLGFAFPRLRPATTRNRLRRRLREVARHTLPADCPLDIVVIAGAGAAALTTAALHETARCLFAGMAPRFVLDGEAQ